MFDDLDDPSTVQVPGDALVRVKAKAATRLRRRYSIMAGVAAAVLLAALVPLVSGDEGKTRVDFADEPTTQSSVDTNATEDGGSPATTTAAAAGVATTAASKDSLVPPGAFARLEMADGKMQAVVSRYDGSNRHVLETDTDEMALQDIRLSHDQSFVVVSATESPASKRFSGNVNQLNIYDVASAEKKSLSNYVASAHITEWQWSPVAPRLAFFASRENATDLIVRDVRTGPDGIVANGPRDNLFGLAWSPDGRSIACGEGYAPRHVRVVSENGGTPVSIARRAGTDLDWSPDSKWMAYSSYVFSDPATTAAPMHVVAADGTGDRALTNQVVVEANYDTRPEWSPDGQWLTYVRNFRADRAPWVTIVNPHGDPDPAGLRWHELNDRLPASDTGSNWSADSATVFTLRVGYGDRLAFNLNTGADDELTTPSAHLSELSPDRKTLGWTTSGGDVMVTDLASRARTPLAAGAEKSSLDFSPDRSAVVAQIGGEFTVLRIDGRKSWRFGRAP